MSKDAEITSVLLNLIDAEYSVRNVMKNAAEMPDRVLECKIEGALKCLEEARRYLDTRMECGRMSGL